jgi:RNA polymerase sigma-B factor
MPKSTIARGLASSRPIHLAMQGDNACAKGTADAAARRRRLHRDGCLTRRWRAGDSRARDELLDELRPVGRRLAWRYARSAADIEDLEQVASIGLLKAIDRFDPTRGVLLSTYARSIALGELRHWLRDGCWRVKVERPVKDLAVRVDAVVPALTARLGRSPSVAEIADAVGSDSESVLAAVEARSADAMASLDEVAASEDDHPALAPLAVEEAGFARVEARARLQPALRSLSPRQRLVVDLRFREDMTQSEIARTLGVSAAQVVRILRGALDRAALAA